MTPREIQQARRKGETDIGSETGAVPPPQIQLDPKFERAFPEQAKAVKEFNTNLANWWRDKATQ